MFRTALERCDLNTEDLPRASIPPQPQNPSQQQSQSRQSTSEDVWDDLIRRESMRRSANRKTLLQNLESSRREAFAKTDSYQKVQENLDDEIDYVQRKTGIKQVSYKLVFHLRQLFTVNDVIIDINGHFTFRLFGK